MPHYIELCKSCSAVISQCRCASPDKEKRYGACAACKAVVATEQEVSFEKELENLINRHSMENASNTPDFILSQYLRACLTAWNVATQRREQWYDRDMRPTLPEGIAYADDK